MYFGIREVKITSGRGRWFIEFMDMDYPFLFVVKTGDFRSGGVIDIPVMTCIVN